MASNRFIRSLAWAIHFFVIASLLMWPVPLPADQAQYFYDELGRLVGVVDGQGNVAVYNYDEVGNLLSIQRQTAGASGIGIFLLAPDRGLVGAQVQINGFGFSPTPADNQVAFNGTPASVSSATANTLVTLVPSGATSGPVTVTNANGTAMSPRAFTVLVPPIISGIAPDRVPQGATTRAVISGFNLTAATAVTFTQSGLSAGILPGATVQTLTVNITVSTTVPAGSYPFSVTTPGGTAQSGTITVTVTPAVPSFGLGKASAFKPFPAQTAPFGPSFAVTQPTSVQMP